MAHNISEVAASSKEATSSGHDGSASWGFWGTKESKAQAPQAGFVMGKFLARRRTATGVGAASRGLTCNNEQRARHGLQGREEHQGHDIELRRQDLTVAKNDERRAQARGEASSWGRERSMASNGLYSRRRGGLEKTPMRRERDGRH